MSAPAPVRRASATAPCVLAGFGLGAFVDGIVLHQVLQWHHLVSRYEDASTVEGLQANTLWDGVFHVGAWLVVLASVYWLVVRGDAVRAAGARRVTGLLLMGVGAFHVVDHLVFHLALEAHHIRMVDDYALYDWGFFALGVVLGAAGRALASPRR